MFLKAIKLEWARRAATMLASFDIGERSCKEEFQEKCAIQVLEINQVFSENLFKNFFLTESYTFVIESLSYPVCFP